MRQACAWVLWVALLCAGSVACKAKPTPSIAGDGGPLDRVDVARARPDGDQARARSNALTFTIDGVRVEAHRIVFKREGKREYIVGACTIDGDTHVVELTHGFTWSASIPLMILINTRSKSVLRSRGAKPDPLGVAPAVAGEGRVAGYFAGTLVDRDGRTRRVTDGSYDVARAAVAEIRATAVFSMNGVRVEGFSSRFVPVGGRFLFQAVITPRPGEAITLIMRLPSLDPGVYAFPGSGIDVRDVRVVQVVSRTGPAPKPLELRKGPFKVVIEAGEAGKRATFSGELHSFDNSRKATIADGVMQFESF